MSKISEWAANVSPVEAKVDLVVVSIRLPKNTILKTDSITKKLGISRTALTKQLVMLAIDEITEAMK